MKNINIAENIVNLRKKQGITQEQLADAVHVSPQAVSKWENGANLPDTQMMPLIAEFFGVSVDVLYYGKDRGINDIYESCWEKTASYPQMSKESYEEALKIFNAAHRGIGHWNGGMTKLIDEAHHISNEGGVSVVSGRGYGALVTRRFFENIGSETVEFSIPLIEMLADEKRMRVMMAIISMSDISLFELAEKTGYAEDELSEVLMPLIESEYIIEKISKHKSLGKTYEINSMYHSGICLILGTLEMLRFSNKEGISCCMGYGDFPIKLDK